MSVQAFEDLFSSPAGAAEPGHVEAPKRRKRRPPVSLTTPLELPRRYWPVVHQFAVNKKIRLATEQLEQGNNPPIRLVTTEAGALQLQAVITDLEEAEHEAA